MRFLKSLTLSALLAIGFLAAPGLVGASKADNGRMYDVCASLDDAVSIAEEYDAIDKGSVATHGLVTNELYASNACSAHALDLAGTNPPVVHALEPFFGSRYVVVQVRVGNDAVGYAVVEESVGQPLDGQPDAFFQDASLTVRLSNIFDNDPTIVVDRTGKGDLPSEVA